MHLVKFKHSLNRMQIMPAADALQALQALNENFLLHYASTGRIELPETAGFLGFVEKVSISKSRI